MQIFLQQASHVIAPSTFSQLSYHHTIHTPFPSRPPIPLTFCFIPPVPLAKGGLLLGLEVVEQDGAFLGFLAPVADDDAGAVDDFSGVAFAVEDAWKERISDE